MNRWAAVVLLGATALFASLLTPWVRLGAVDVSGLRLGNTLGGFALVGGPLARAVAAGSWFAIPALGAGAWVVVFRGAVRARPAHIALGSVAAVLVGAFAGVMIANGVPVGWGLWVSAVGAVAVTVGGLGSIHREEAD